MLVNRIGLKCLYQWYPWTLALSEEIGPAPSTIEIERYTREVIMMHETSYHTRIKALDTKVYFFGKDGTFLGMRPFEGIFARTLFEVLSLSFRSGHPVTLNEISYVVVLSKEMSDASPERHVSIYTFPHGTSMNDVFTEDVNRLMSKARWEIGLLRNTNT